MKKGKKKGFTLVELLVVIAILAILATVSVVGYIGFTNKAKESNALVEYTQAKEIIRGETLAAPKNSIYMEDDIFYYVDSAELPIGANIDLKAIFPELAELKGTLTVVADANPKSVYGDNQANDYILTITYTLDGVSIADGQVVKD